MINVENVHISYVNLDPNLLSRFPNLFPKLRHLILTYVRMRHEAHFTPVHFQNLEHLKFAALDNQSENIPNNLLAHSNPQLRILKIATFGSMQLNRALDFTNTNRSITKLSIWFWKHSLMEPGDIQRIAKQHPFEHRT